MRGVGAGVLSFLRIAISRTLVEIICYESSSAFGFFTVCSHLPLHN